MLCCAMLCSSLGMGCQALESPAARRALGMREGQTGVLVIHVVPEGEAEGHATLCRRGGDELWGWLLGQST